MVAGHEEQPVVGGGTARSPVRRRRAVGRQGPRFATEVDTCTAYLSCSSKRVDGENDDDTVSYEERTTSAVCPDFTRMAGSFCSVQPR